VNAADTAFILVATAPVLFMTLPGLALFCGGLVRRETCCRSSPVASPSRR
jgi:ammonium transporter, Amt family